ncbi:hypothetical protein Sjap_024592 [Stephania japonica]|uniref:Uncharacterized protein n=1 Tax=Stephania japonica TaxID=461633 RepID=A0AAP0EFV3_9MAGN
MTWQGSGSTVHHVAGLGLTSTITTSPSVSLTLFSCVRIPDMERRRLAIISQP